MIPDQPAYEQYAGKAEPAHYLHCRRRVPERAFEHAGALASRVNAKEYGVYAQRQHDCYKHADAEAPESVNGVFFLRVDYQVHQADAERDCECGVAKERGDDVYVQPVALERRHKGLDLLGYVGRHEDVCHGEEGNRHDESAECLVFVFPLDNQVDQYDRPGPERHRLEQVRDWYVADLGAHLVGFIPPDGYRGSVGQETERCEPGRDVADALAPELDVRKVENHCEQVEKGRYLEKRDVDVKAHLLCPPETALKRYFAPSLSSMRPKSSSNAFLFLFALPAAVIITWPFSPCTSLIHTLL